MGLSDWLVEAEAEAIYRRAGFDPASPPGIVALAAAVFGSTKFAILRGLRTPAAFDAAARELRVRHGLSHQAMTFVIAHEVAEYHLECLGYREEDRERLCDAIAAALIAPARAFLPTLRRVGLDLPSLALAFKTTQTVVALRYGETTREPIAVVDRARIRLRGEGCSWPGAPELRRLALADEPVESNFRRTTLTDADRRAALTRQIA